MLRFKILASTIPLILAGIVAGLDQPPGPKPCIAMDRTSVQITATPWKAQSVVSFTSDPAAATVRVQIVDNPETADFAVVDDAETPDENSCGITAATQFIAITAGASASVSAPVIYLTHDDGADYRIYVRSRTFTVQEAAALVVGAHRAPTRLAAASL
jgi:hypothetical protein